MGTLPTEELEMRRSLLQEQLARVGDLRLGSLIHRYRRCGKPTCSCSRSRTRRSWGLDRLQERWGEDSNEHSAG